MYIGVGEGDIETIKILENLEKQGCDVRAKTVFAYKNKGVKTHIVSNGKKIKTGSRYFTSRFSTKLRQLISQNQGKVDFINIDNIRFRIQKEREA
ncbi:MAG: hypothetical protein UW30_C0011G0020 [Candidatus Giovannonibacteria bacterium GW2011_GWA2_44_13b]|uniref:Uncharacterized protein n=2 Tax=Candidatus Giovannoniibacteriota TaxID=1752738 RepID=A0A0G1K0A8_9BACT|nr:MAG: hypothetical protein UW30_C0011G0020 [Candidatus Giovannonibacteria bacterium GW2011_GWA2_44_13b]OGF82078.1 MAG: hypothetical protein A2924_01940 [Candidatus Giovannonibacteria bacterium RIFCSPLOWO2_01_FULL_44_16]